MQIATQSSIDLLGINKLRSGKVREVFDLSGFSRVMAAHPDRATALAAAAAKSA